MMREIFFRGKCKKTGEMVYGELRFGILSISINAIIDIPPTWENPCGDQVTQLVEVDPETVGQLTGLSDKNGVSIYEGDIVKHAIPKNISHAMMRFEPPPITGVIEYDECCASFRTSQKEGYDEPIHEDVVLEVIGNIHETPELLEES